MSTIFNLLKYPFDTKFIKVNDYDIAYIDEGEADNVLLFIHGLGSYLKAWDRNLPELKKIILNLPFSFAYKRCSCRLKITSDYLTE